MNDSLTRKFSIIEAGWVRDYLHSAGITTTPQGNPLTRNSIYMRTPQQIAVEYKVDVMELIDATFREKPE